jgi:hypothetical protein
MLKPIDRRSFLAGTLCTVGCAALAPAIPRRSEILSHNVEVVAYEPLDDRPAFKLAITERHGRWWLYTGHFWHRGWSVVEVTDPRRPRLANFLEGPHNTFTGQVDLHGDTMITALEQGLTNANWGFDKDGPFEEGVYLWDLADPERPRRVSHWRTGARGTHRNTYAGGRYMHLAAAAPGYDGYIYRIVDIADRAHPVEVGRWSVPGQERTSGQGDRVDASIGARSRGAAHRGGIRGSRYDGPTVQRSARKFRS